MPLRVAILLGSWSGPRWIRTLLERVQSSPHARIVTVIEAHVRPPPPAGGLLYRAYSLVDDWLYRRRAPVDVLAETDLAPVLAGIPVVPADRPGDLDLDVILDLGGGQTSARARHGTWSYDHAGALAGFWEVLDASPTTPSTLRLRHGDDDAGGPGRVIYESRAPTDHQSVARNRQNNLAKSSDFVLRKLRDLDQEGAAALAASGGGDAPAEAPPRPAETPAIARGLARLGARIARERWATFRRREQWTLAYRRGAEPFTPLVPPADRFWADPFPVEQDDGWLVFFEEYEHRRRRGHIAAVHIGRDGRAGTPDVVLEADTHLSYPCVFRWNGDHYMLPETGERRTIELFRASRFPDRWEPCATLMTGVRAADSTLCEIDGRFWLWSCMAAEGALAADELHVFHAPSPLGPFRPHRKNPVKSDARSARPAGRLYLQDGAWHRPAQDCAGRYGRAMVMNRITCLTPDAYAEVPAGRLEPDWDPRVVATHTYNRAGELTIVDALRLR